MNQPQSTQVVGPGLRRLLVIVLVLFAVLVVDSVYLSTVTFLEWFRQVELQDALYQSAFLVHLAIGFLITVPAIVFAVIHLRIAIDRPNPLAVRLGLFLFVTVIVLLISGILLTRGMPIVELQHPTARTVTYWLHVIAPVAAAWLFVLHRMAGPRIRWRAGGSILVLSLVVGIGVILIAEPKVRETGEGSFFPSLARTSDGKLISADNLMQDEYCRDCHEDVYGQWQHSAHRFASFNNPAYLFAVRNTRHVALERDGDVTAARFCAGCHDPVPLFSGAFDDPEFDDENHPTAHAGITCVSCHAIERLASPRGNSDYVISAPEHYPFAFSDNGFLSWVNGLLIKGKPEFHKRTFLKPMHKTAEFCATCHKVHLPEALNKYKWLRGQNHYDSFLLSGVSGHGVQSFYYPDQAVSKCADCHMPLTASDDFGALPNDPSGTLTVHGHHFPAANTALPHLLGLPEHVNEAHRTMLEGALRVDIFALREGEGIDAPLVAPLRPTMPELSPGQVYSLDVVLRTLRVGHLFTEGTADSNQVWLEVTLADEAGPIAVSGAMVDEHGTVDPWSHFVNAYVLDREGNRIDRRNAEDIFTKLYDHQIPPGAADTVHYQFTVPERFSGALSVTAVLKYRKFDTTYMRAFQGRAFVSNDLPVTEIASDRVTFGSDEVQNIETWQRWNDYGIGLFRKPDRGELRQAEYAFQKVSELGRPEGPLNLARVYLREGRLDDATRELRVAAERGAYPWSVTWFSALVDLQNGELEAAIEGLQSLMETRFQEAQDRGFDFSRDYRLRNTLAQTYFELAKLRDSDVASLDDAVLHFQAVLDADPENLRAHYGLAQVYARLGQQDKAARHREQHETYRLDDNAHDRAVANSRRRDPAANHASEAVVIYALKTVENND